MRYWLYTSLTDDNYFIYKTSDHTYDIVERRCKKCPDKNWKPEDETGSMVDITRCKLITKEKANEILMRTYFEKG